MPQFDFAHVFWPQLAWLAVIFSLLFFGVVLPTLPKLGRAIDARENKIKNDIEEAETAKAESDNLALANAETLVKAQNEARAALTEMKAKAAQSTEKKLAAANVKIDAKMAKASEELAKIQSEMLAGIEAIAVESAADIVEKLGGAKPSAVAAKVAAKSALTQIASES